MSEKATTKVITVEVKPQYGKWVYYPICETSHIFTQIAGTKSLTDDTLLLIKKLGYEIKAQSKSLEDLINSMIR